jgi:DNA-binding transcriptional ArsR family regulator
MPKQSEALNLLFQALADPTRRAVVERLGKGEAGMSELAQPFKMALPSFAQHLDMLERSGLVKSHKRGRVRTYQLAPRRLKLVEDWMAAQRLLWNKRLDQLDDYLHTLRSNEHESCTYPQTRSAL